MILHIYTNWPQEGRRGTDPSETVSARKGLQLAYNFNGIDKVNENSAFAFRFS